MIGKQKTITTQAEAVVHFIRQMDIEMIDMLLEDHRTYQDVRKPVFIGMLGRAFDEFARAGDTFLNAEPGYCNFRGCKFKCRGNKFVGNHSRKFMSVVMVVKKGMILDMYDCSVFKTKKEIENLSDRIMIDCEPNI